MRMKVECNCRSSCDTILATGGTGGTWVWEDWKSVLGWTWQKGLKYLGGGISSLGVGLFTLHAHDQTKGIAMHSYAHY